MADERVEDRVSSTEGETAGHHVWLTRGSSYRADEYWQGLHDWLERLLARSGPISVFGWVAREPDGLFRAFGYDIPDRYDLLLQWHQSWEVEEVGTPLQIGPNAYDRLLFVFQDKTSAQMFQLKWGGQ